MPLPIKAKETRCVPTNVERCRVLKHLYNRRSQFDTDYAVILVQDIHDAQEYTCLVDSRIVNLDWIEHMILHEIVVTATKRGLKMDPWIEQPLALHQAVFASQQKTSLDHRKRTPELEQQEEINLRKRLAICPWVFARPTK